MYVVDGPFNVIGAGSVVYRITIRITTTAWDACELDVQEGVNNILANQPIQLLSSSGKSNGIKLESKGMEFHTQTKKRLQAPGQGIPGGGGVLSFTQCKKGWGH